MKTNDELLNDAQLMALNTRIRPFTVRLVDRTDLRAGGTCVAMQLGLRYFFATAAHVVPRNHSFEIVKRPSDIAEISNFKAIYRDPDSDVAILEVDKNQADVCVSQWLTHHHIYSQYRSHNDSWVILCGFPGELLLPTQRSGNPNTYYCVPDCHITTVLNESQWPTDGMRERPPSSDVDIFLKYEKPVSCEIRHGSSLDIVHRETAVDHPKLAGISGGGIWLVACKEESVWQPWPVLIGLEISWFRDRGWVRGTRIGKWLELVQSHYPELHGLIEEISSNKLMYMEQKTE